MKHPHCEVIKAWADGAKIQCPAVATEEIVANRSDYGGENRSGKFP